MRMLCRCFSWSGTDNAIVMYLKFSKRIDFIQTGQQNARILFTPVSLTSANITI